jgi:hypothetical protein
LRAEGRFFVPAEQEGEAGQVVRQLADAVGGVAGELCQRCGQAGRVTAVTAVTAVAYTALEESIRLPETRSNAGFEREQWDRNTAVTSRSLKPNPNLPLFVRALS